ncbi:MAG: hypothetical protein WC866_03985 [Patescibacteria group bacterium]|jgi:hypothetical protein
MQLKKRFSINKQLAVGAMTAVMLVSSLPALASDGEFESRGKHLGLKLGLGAKIGLSEETRELEKEIKNELKEVKNELRKSVKNRPTTSATVSAEVTDRKRCKKESQTEYQTALKKARNERDVEYKKVQTSYLASLKSARDLFHATITASTSASGTAVVSASSVAQWREARRVYQASVKTAQQTFKEAKRSISNTYHLETKAARKAYEADLKTCKN